MLGFLAPIAGAVLGGLFGGKGPKQTTTATLDPTVQRYRDLMLAQANALAKSPTPFYGGPLTAGLSPWTTQAAGIFGGTAGGLLPGALGVLGGDPTAIAAQMNPYQSSVLAGLNDQYKQLRDQATLDLNDQATRAGAFGGDRQGVAQGVMLGQLGRSQAQQAADLLYRGYGDIMNRAQQNLGIGLGAAGSLGNLGVFGTQLQQQNQANLYNEWLRWQQEPYRRLQTLQGAVGTAGALGGGTSTVSQPGSGILGGAIGGALAGQGLWNMFQNPTQRQPYPCDTSVTGMCY